MTTEHIEHPEDTTEDAHAPRIGYRDTHEQTGSDAETEMLPDTAPIEIGPEFAACALHFLRRRRPPIQARYNRWRMYHQTLPDGSIQWHALQPDHIDQPYFGPNRYGTHGTHAHVLNELQLALAKAAA